FQQKLAGAQSAPAAEPVLFGTGGATQMPAASAAPPGPAMTPTALSGSAAAGSLPGTLVTGGAGSSGASASPPAAALATSTPNLSSLASSQLTGLGGLNPPATGLGSLGSTDPLSGLGGASAGDPLSGLTGLGTGDPLSGLTGLGADSSGVGLPGGTGGATSLADLFGGTTAGFAPTDPLAAGGGSQSSGLLGMLDGVANQIGVSPALAKAVAQTESGLNPNATSSAGAVGLMQLMPGTFQQYAGAATNTPSGLPVAGQVTQPFGPTSTPNEPPLDWNGQYYQHFHTGIDLAVTPGTPIHATLSGTVQLRSDPSGYGNLIVVSNGPWDVLYGHTSGHPSGIRTGSFVNAGDVVGFAGSTGNSTGPHVHYELRYNGRIVDPTPFVAPAAAPSATNPVANARAGVSYLKDLLTRFGNNVPKALAAYNAGPAAVQKYGGIPPYPETQAYVQKALQYARDYGA
ncbi:MAG: transglycosylase SLT domain-containing protein, partial [Chloroflexota bacterium]